MGFVRPTVCILILVAVGCGQQALSPDDAPAPSSKLATSPSSLTSAPIPSPSPTPTPSLFTSLPTPSPSPLPTPTPVPYWQTVERNGEIEGYGYAPRNVGNQARRSDLIARVRYLSVEPSFGTNPYDDDPDRRYLPYVHFSFSIIEPLKGTPVGDVVVVEYTSHSGRPTKARAIEEAKKWIASERDEWWNKQEAIIFLDDARFTEHSFVPENSTGAHYRFADHFSCNDFGQCATWSIGANDFYSSWVWLPLIGPDALLEVPDSERMFRVLVVPYGANRHELQIAPASLANIKAILETHWSEYDVRADYFDRHRLIWEAKGSDSYSYVESGVVGGGSSFFPARKIVVRNGEAVEAFFVEDVELSGKVWPAGSRIDPEKMNGYGSDLPTLETTMWGLAESWARGHQYTTDVSFDYEFGYPNAIKLESPYDETESFIHASEYTPLEN